MNVLFLSHRLPYAPNRGDRYRSFHILEFLSRRHRVDVVSLVHDASEAAQAPLVARVAASVHVAPVARARAAMNAVWQLPSTRPMSHILLSSRQVQPAIDRIARDGPPDVVFAVSSTMARFALRPPLDRCALVLDLVDVDSEKWAGMARVSRVPMRWVYAREAALVRRFERVAMAKAHVSLVVNDREARLAAALFPAARVDIIANGIDADAYRPPGPPADSAEVLFCGVMNYHPNVRAAVWLATQAWPLVRAARPDARLTIVGASPVRAVRELASTSRGISVTGAVADVRPFLWRAAVATAPLSIARGVQSKVLESVGSRLPTVVTTPVAEGLPAQVLAACTVADGAEPFASAILDLLALTPAARRARAERADLEALRWDRQLAPLDWLMEEAAASR